MTFHALICELYRRGVTYREADGRLRVTAPSGLPDELRSAMREHKADLLFLCSGGITVYGKGQGPAEWKDAA